MKKFIGAKSLKAREMNLGEYNNYRGLEIPSDEDLKKEGYLVEYKDGYVSWSPKEAFEKSYMMVSDNNKITKENVENFIKNIVVKKFGEKTCVVQATLNNGFVITETSSCVDPKNYDEKIGIEICMKKITDKVWELLGFFLQTSLNGIKK